MIKNIIGKVLAAAKPLRAPLSFQKGNAKLGPNVWTFSLPAGYTCPGARACLAVAVPTSSSARLVDGPEATFRCFAASDEVRYKSARESRWSNYRAIEAARIGAERRGADPVRAIADVILFSLPAKARTVRVHVSGDYYRPEYLRAWLTVARQRPEVTFYSYSKSVSIISAEAKAGSIPPNFVFTFSAGGRQDHLIADAGIRTARVFLSESEAEAAGLPVDHDDTHAQENGPSFALVIHGAQRAGSEAGKAVSRNRKAGFTGYGRTHANA